MANISRITDRLFTGGDLPSHLGTKAMLADLSDVRSAGITHIIDCRFEWSDLDFVAAHAPDVRYLQNGQDDAGQRMPDSWFDRGVGFALDAFRDGEGAVLAHCHMGINRGPSLAYAIMLAQGCDPVRALASIRAARPVAGIAYAFDALEWWRRRAGTPADVAARQASAVQAWFRQHPLDVVRIIREVRQDEDGRRWSSA